MLLTNDRGLLPLTDDVARVAVVGEFARSPRFQGAGSSKVNPTRVDDALGALRARPVSYTHLDVYKRQASEGLSRRYTSNSSK